MSILNRSLLLSVVALGLAAGVPASADDPSDAWRGWYLPGTGSSPTITVNFKLEGSFWVATMQLASDHEVNIRQNNSFSFTTFHRATSQSEVDHARRDDVRMFFDARFFKKNPSSIRLVFVRRVNDYGVNVVYVEPLP